MKPKEKLSKELSEIANITHGRIRTAEVFTDFAMHCALTLSMKSDPLHAADRREQLDALEKNYHSDELEAFKNMFLQVLDAAQKNLDAGCYEDLFEEAFMLLGTRNRYAGQDFTPSDLARLMVRIAVPDGIELPECGYFTQSDPTCGSGVLLLAGAERIAQLGFNPCTQFVAQAADIDIRCVYLTYLSLSIYGIPAVVIHGNSLTLDEYDCWYTPAYLWGKWVWKEPMPFGKNGYTRTELLKMLDEPSYAAFRMTEHLLSRPTTINESQEVSVP